MDKNGSSMDKHGQGTESSLLGNIFPIFACGFVEHPTTELLKLEPLLPLHRRGFDQSPGLRSPGARRTRGERGPGGAPAAGLPQGAEPPGARDRRGGPGGRSGVGTVGGGGEKGSIRLFWRAPVFWRVLESSFFFCGLPISSGVVLDFLGGSRLLGVFFLLKETEKEHQPLLATKQGA